ncbi:MAG: hypothetical protein ACOY33_07450 [Pseudomonadota bacterium]
MHAIPTRAGARLLPALLPGIALLLPAAPAAAGFRGELGAEGWQFFAEGTRGQDDTVTSVRLRPEAWHERGDDRYALILFARHDSADPERSHADIREASWLRHGSFGADAGWDLRAGIRQVFWGVTEGMHLVDIVNQTDSVESLDGEQKLGQPMLNLSLENGAHTLDVYALFGARERTFAGRDGRLRLPLPVDGDAAEFESSNGRDRVDGALRYQYGDHGLQLGLSLFGGSGREPELRPVVDPAQLVFSGPVPVAFLPGYTPHFVPFYPVILQAGLDAQYTAGDWLWKLETIERLGQQDAYYAADAGFEYTQVGVFGSRIDVGWLAEYLYDERGAAATQPFEHDILVGARIAFNDPASSELLASLIADENSGERLWSLEGSRRFGDALKLSLEARAFAGMPAPQDPFAFLFAPDTTHKLRPLADDDFLRLELTWFF